MSQIVAVYVQPESDGVMACVSIEMLAGPKRFARVFPDGKPPIRLEWGHYLHETAVEVWRNPECGVARSTSGSVGH